MKNYRNKLESKLKDYSKKQLRDRWFYYHDPKYFRKLLNKKDRMSNRKYCRDYINCFQKTEMISNPFSKKSRGWYTW